MPRISLAARLRPARLNGFNIKRMASVTTPQLLTAEEYAQLEDVDGFRDELIEGERVLSPNPVYPHTAVIDQLAQILKGQLFEFGTQPLRVAREAGWKFHNPRSGRDSVPGPDLMIVRDEDARRAIKNRGWLEGTPLLAVEVISPSERKGRRMQKIALYLEMGVPHAVEVDYTKRVVRVHSAGSADVVVYREGDEMTAPFRASVKEIFSVMDE